ncbi:MAG: AAA family ATPase [Bacilli bacterium]|nr:AAA family ATPase [Bacilli bacterium]
MNREDFLKDIYKDFFGVETKTNLEKSESKKGSQEEMTNLFERIDNLYITIESKELLKKIIEYMRKYNEKLEKVYIPFRITIEANNDQIKKELQEILFESVKYFSYVKDNKRKDISLFKIEKEINFDSGFITLNDLDGLNLEDNKVKIKFFYSLEEYLKKDEQSIFVILGKKEEINNFFLGNESLKNKYFDLYINNINPDINDIYNYVLNKVEFDKVKLLDYITATYKNDTDYVEYQNDLIKYISFNKQLPKIKESKSIDEIFSSLNELVGLKKVKKVLYELVDVINLKEKAGKNLNISEINLHMVFLGNPGTGKTTIARIVSEILYNLGYIKENKLVEVSSKDLIAEYVGQTQSKTMSVIEKSLNGVLFIDDAYTLADKGNNSYNGEAIATLIQAMENYRDKLVVIFAGYTKEMQDFLNSNSGIVSRIGYTLEFDDYTTDELTTIFDNMMNKSGFVVKEDAISYLKEIIDENKDMKNFGNARFVRNIYEKTIVKHASNVKDKKNKIILKTITKNDINTENLILK